MAERHYLVGLPVTITVSDDGTVTYTVHTEESSSAVNEHWRDGDYDEGDPIPDDTFYSDLDCIADDHEARNRATPTESETHQ